MSGLLWGGAMFAGFLVQVAIGFAYSARRRSVHLALLGAAQLENVRLKRDNKLLQTQVMQMEFFNTRDGRGEERMRAIIEAAEVIKQANAPTDQCPPPAFVYDIYTGRMVKNEDDRI